MKIKVWTSYSMDMRRKPKCIFMGEASVLPRVGDYVACREGFGCETVKAVTLDLVRNEVEIRVGSSDPENAYGGCLYRE